MRQATGRFSGAEREAVYRAIFERRDVRRNFLPEPIPDAVMMRLLTAAHYAGSVGFMQPWDFVVIRNRTTKHAVKDLFVDANTKASARYAGAKGALYGQLKLEGIEEAPINLCITCSRRRGATGAWPLHGTRNGLVQHLLCRSESLAGRSCRRHRCRVGQYSGPRGTETPDRCPQDGDGPRLSLPRLCVQV